MGVGTNLRRLRSQTKFSQQDVADQVGVSRTTYVGWENENSDVKSEYIPKLAEIFNVEIKDLFSDSKGIQIINNVENKDNATSHIIINVTDKDTAEAFTKQMLDFIKLMKK